MILEILNLDISMFISQPALTPEENVLAISAVQNRCKTKGNYTVGRLGILALALALALKSIC